MTYERQIASAKKLIEKFGGDCTYVSSVRGAPTDTDKPWREADVADTQTAVKAAFVPYQTQSRPGLSQSEQVPVAVNEVYVAAASMPSVTPRVGDGILRGSDQVRHRITSVDTYNINGEVIMYVFQAVAA